MDARQREALVQRLVASPQDQGAIAQAHAAGQQDPEGYARLLEQVGMATPLASIASHWLNEAASVWLTTFQDPNRAAIVLQQGIERDPTSDVLAHRLIELYRAADDPNGVAGTIELRAAALARLARSEPELLPKAAELYEELGRLAAEPPWSDLQRAKQAYARAVDLDPTSQFAIYSLRELHKAAGEYAEAIPYFGMEVALVVDPQRKLALYLDEAEVAKLAGRQDRAITALRHALKIDATDPTLQQQLGTAILEKHRAGREPSQAEREEGGDLFVALAETYPGEHGFIYSLCALELAPAHDRAMQLALHYGAQLGRLAETAPLAAAYLRDNPHGVMATEAHQAAGNAAPPLAPRPSSGPPGAAHRADEVAPRGLQRPPSLELPAVSARPDSGFSVDDLLERADALAKKSRKNEAIAVYRQVLDLDPVNAEALNYLQEQLPLKRKYPDLRDVLLAAIEAPEALDDDRLGWLRELAAVTENQLRDLDAAVYAWQRILDIDAGDDEAQDQLKRLLEKARRWDDLARLLRDEADRTEDVEVRISLERNLAKLHLSRRKDYAAAGEAWARIAVLSPGDDAALQEAVTLFEQAQRGDLAADVIAETVRAIDDDLVKRQLYFKLGDVRIAQGLPLIAAEALAEGAEELGDAEMWARAEGAFAHAQAWEPAANAADQQAAIATDDAVRADAFARSAGYYLQDRDVEEAVTRLEQAVTLDPTNEQHANALEELLVSAERVDELVQLFLARASKLSEPAARIALHKRAASIQRDRLQDLEAARASFALVLEDGEDEETLEWLAADAEQSGNAAAAVDYLGRLCAAMQDVPRKVQTALRQAELCATRLEDVERAAGRYEFILADLDPTHEVALEQLADLEIARGNYKHGAEVLERFLKVTDDRTVKLETASRLAQIYELNLSSPPEALRLLSFIHTEDPDDLDATQRLCDLAETLERWPLVAELMVELIAIEGDDEQVSEMTRRLAEILHARLGKGAEALDVLGGVADRGDEPCRQAYVELGDELGELATVAERVVSWHQSAPASAEREEALHGAFDRFVRAGRAHQAVGVARTLIASDSARPEIAETLERLSLELEDREALALAHELRAGVLEGDELARERVRQAEVLLGASATEEEAVRHGESALGGAEPATAATLLPRLAALRGDPVAKVEIYERHIARCQTIPERITALSRAVEVAAEVEQLPRARTLFDVALMNGPDDDTLEQLVSEVRAADERRGNRALREVLVEALAAGGQAARDEGRTRSHLLQLAAQVSHAELGDQERAFEWLSDSLILYADDAGLDTLEELAGRVGDYGRADAALTRALGEVFDGPLVRRLLARRAALRQERLGDVKAAVADWERLHELSPTDADVNQRLEALYEQLGEYRGIVALLEDQILRNKDKDARAELARRVARLCQERLDDPRETADAWRRVLRLTPNDEEGKEGLARAKEEMLQRKPRDSAPGGDAETSEIDAGPAPLPAVARARELPPLPEIPEPVPAHASSPEATDEIARESEVPESEPATVEPAALASAATEAETPAPVTAVVESEPEPAAAVAAKPVPVALSRSDEFEAATEIMNVSSLLGPGASSDLLEEVDDTDESANEADDAGDVDDALEIDDDIMAAAESLPPVQKSTRRSVPPLPPPPGAPGRPAPPARSKKKSKAPPKRTRGSALGRDSDD